MSKSRKGISVADIEKAMGQKADEISPYVFDPETGAFERRITFRIKPHRKKGRKP